MNINERKELFVKRAKEVHGNKYDYSKIEYVNYETKVCIICPEHGEFWQTPHNHIGLKQGCQKCYRDKQKLDRYEFIWKAIQKHGYKYDYRKVDYKSGNEKVCIICPEHGEFWQTPNSHLQGKGCSKCAGRYLDRAFFIEKAKRIHGDKYDYSKVNYNRTDEKVCIICPKHGEFWQNPNNHLQGQGCPKCKIESTKNILTMTRDGFIKKSIKKYGDKYDYSKVNYTDIKTKVCIICPEHGEFWQTPRHHLDGHECPNCKESKLEKEVVKYLENNNIKYERQKRFNWLKFKKSLSLDFYLPDYNVGIECQGKQHFEPRGMFGGEAEFKRTQERDKQKLKLCNENNVPILYYNYNDKNRIMILDKTIKA
jgi:hypothetical protein